MENKNVNNAVSIKLADYQPESNKESVDRKGWVDNGPKNNFPIYLQDLAQSSPVHGALCVSISEMIAGKGITSATGQAKLDELKADKSSRLAAYDLKHFGGFFLEVIYTVDKASVAKINHLPYDTCRIAVEGEEEDITGVWYSADWNNTRKKKNTPVFIPKFNSAEQARQNDARQVYWFFRPSGNAVYPVPDYWSGANYIELDRQVSIYHVNNIMNGLFPSFIVNFFNGLVDEETKQQIIRDWENKMSGARNAGKFIMGFNENGTTPPQITPFPLSDADKQYQFISEECTTKVMIAHRVTTPLIFGVRSQSGFGSNKDEMAIGLEIFNNQVIQPYQRAIAESYEKILNFEISNITCEIIPNTPISFEQQPQPAPVQQSLEKKKTALDEFIELGEDSPEGYILIDSFSCDEVADDENETELARVLHLASTGTARPNASSEQDEVINDKLYITRYRYRGERKPNTREFCDRMLSADKIYRKEDILLMENRAVNPGWGPEGADTYSIWLYKGGGSCHHFWQKEVYVSAEGMGIDVNSPNAQSIAVRKAEAAGYKVRNEALVAKLPVDMPYEGFLPTNKRFN